MTRSASAVLGRDDRLGDGVVGVAVPEDLHPLDGRPVRRADRVDEFVGGAVVLHDGLGRALERLGGEDFGVFLGESARDAGLRNGLDEIEDEGGAAAVDRGCDVHLRLLDLDELAHVREEFANLVGQIAGRRRGHVAGLGGEVRHDADDAGVGARLDERGRDARGDGDESLVGRQIEFREDGLDDVGLDRDEHHVGVGRARHVVRRLFTVVGDRGEGVGVEVAGDDRVAARLPEPGEEGAPHVSAADNARAYHWC